MSYVLDVRDGVLVLGTAGTRPEHGPNSSTVVERDASGTEHEVRVRYLHENRDHVQGLFRLSPRVDRTARIRMHVSAAARTVREDLRRLAAVACAERFLPTAIVQSSPLVTVTRAWRRTRMEDMADAEYVVSTLRALLDCGVVSRKVATTSRFPRFVVLDGRVLLRDTEEYALDTPSDAYRRKLLAWSLVMCMTYRYRAYVACEWTPSAVNELNDILETVTGAQRADLQTLRIVQVPPFRGTHPWKFLRTNMYGVVFAEFTHYLTHGLLPALSDVSPEIADWRAFLASDAVALPSFLCAKASTKKIDADSKDDHHPITPSKYGRSHGHPVRVPASGAG